jgi:hypothetical protein
LERVFIAHLWELDLHIFASLFRLLTSFTASATRKLGAKTDLQFVGIV